MGAAALRLIDSENRPTTCAHCARREDEIKGLQRDIRAAHARYADLRRDLEADAEASELWPMAMEVFLYWMKVCDHPNAQFRFDRFEEVKPYLKRYGRKICEQAIRGAAYDPFVTQRKNGRSKKHDDWSLIFRSSAKLEDFAARAPGLRGS